MNKNEAIAEFMGKSRHQEYKSHFRVENEDGSVGMIHAEEFEYHTSWDWLMPVVQKCYDSGAEGQCIGDITMHLTEGNLEGTYKAVVEFIESLSVKSVEADTKAVDEAFFAGFCHALEYVKREIENVGDIEHEVDESVGDLSLSGTIYIQLDQYLDADGLVDEVMRKYERDTTKDGTPNTQDK
jgi:hypothetical protein